MNRTLHFTLVFALVVGTAAAATANEAPAAGSAVGGVVQVVLEIPAGAEASPDFDVERATQAYLDLLTPAQKARSDAYFEGGYWLDLVAFLYGLAVGAFLLFSRLSAWLRDKTKRTRWHGVNAALFAAGYVVATTVLGFPLALYRGYVREHAYDLSNLSFDAWLADEGKGLGLGIVFGMLGFGLLYAVFRRAPRTWWMWGTAVGMAMFTFLLIIGPVFVAPLFNHYKTLPDGPIRTSILRLARANGIPAADVYWFDASKQHKRISANVSGFLGTTRISLNDNLLARSSHESIEAVMGHEMGHYALNHVSKHLSSLAILLFAGFAWVAWAYRRLSARYGARWRVDGIADPAGSPLLLALFSVWFFVTTPITNSMIRVAEVEADIFGLNAAGQPDAFAHTAMQLSEYRKIKPGPLEEVIFFDHPSGYHRVRMAMRWKKEHLGDKQPRPGAASPEAVP